MAGSAAARMPSVNSAAAAASVIKQAAVWRANPASSWLCTAGASSARSYSCPWVTGSSAVSKGWVTLSGASSAGVPPRCGSDSLLRSPVRPIKVSVPCSAASGAVSVRRAAALSKRAVSPPEDWLLMVCAMLLTKPAVSSAGAGAERSCVKPVWVAAGCGAWVSGGSLPVRLSTRRSTSSGARSGANRRVTSAGSGAAGAGSAVGCGAGAGWGAVGSGCGSRRGRTAS